MAGKIQQNDTIKILSFDPGTTAFGWAFSEHSPATNSFEVQKFGDIRATKMAMRQKENVLRYGKRLVALNIIYDEVKKLLKDLKPDYVVSEDTFYSHYTPQAYGPLLLCCHTVENLLFNAYHYPSTDPNDVVITESASVLYKIPPKSIKFVMSGTGKSFKLDMLYSLEEQMAKGRITFKHNKSFDAIRGDMNEHRVDAISCGYTFTQTILPQLQS